MEGLKIIPYTATDGVPTFTDSFIKGLFHRMEEEDAAGAVFYDGSVTCADDFLKTMKFGKNSLFVVEFQGKLAGCVWLNNFEVRRADFHFCFFSPLQGRDAIEAGREIVSELLTMTKDNGEYIFDLFVGLTPTTNRAAIRWCRRMGFSTLGVLPAGAWDAASGKSVPGLVSYVERGNYGQGR